MDLKLYMIILERNLHNCPISDFSISSHVTYRLKIQTLCYSALTIEAMDFELHRMIAENSWSDLLYKMLPTQ